MKQQLSFLLFPIPHPRSVQQQLRRCWWQLLLCFVVVSTLRCSASLEDSYDYSSGHLSGRTLLVKSTEKYLNYSCTNSYVCSLGNLVCLFNNETNTSACGHCNDHQQCEDIVGNQYLCTPEYGDSWCLRKSLWPLNEWDYLTFLVLFFGGATAAGGGIGGGGVFIPVLILLGGFRMKDAVPLSNVMITGASIATFIQTFPMRHPNADRPLIDYNLALLMQPLALSGTIIGVILNSIFPEWLILTLLILTLTLTVYRTAKKGLTIYKKEKKLAILAKRTVELEDRNNNSKENRPNDEEHDEKEMDEVNSLQSKSKPTVSKEDKCPNNSIQVETVLSKIMNSLGSSGSTEQQQQQSNSSKKEIASDNETHEESEYQEKEPSTIHSGGAAAAAGGSSSNGGARREKQPSSRSGSKESVKNLSGSASEQPAEVTAGTDEDGLSDTQSSPPEPAAPAEQNSDVPAARNVELQKILKSERKNPWLKQLTLFGVLILVGFHSLLIGGKGDSILGVTVCTPLYWGLFVTIFPILFGLTAVVSVYLVRLEEKKYRAFYSFLPGDIHWNTVNTCVTALLSLSAGILASLLGIGGGMILSPLMLELQVLPTVTAATSSYMILFTSLAAVAQFAVLHRILWDYGGTLLVLGFLSGFLGQTVIFFLIKKYQKSSYLILCVVIIIGISTVLLGVTGAKRVTDQIYNGMYMGFNSYCAN